MAAVLDTFTSSEKKTQAAAVQGKRLALREVALKASDQPCAASAAIGESSLLARKTGEGEYQGTATDLLATAASGGPDTSLSYDGVGEVRYVFWAKTHTEAQLLLLEELWNRYAELHGMWEALSETEGAFLMPPQAHVEEEEVLYDDVLRFEPKGRGTIRAVFRCQGRGALTAIPYEP